MTKAVALINAGHTPYASVVVKQLNRGRDALILVRMGTYGAVMLVIPQEEGVGGVGLRTVVALDYYTVESERLDGSVARGHTDVGLAVHQAKYWEESPGTREIARERLGMWLCELARTYELCREVDAVVGVPGHDMAEESLSQSLAVDISLALERPLVPIRARSTCRPSLKEHRVDLTDFYFFDDNLTGLTLLIVDDVYESGTTMRAIAQAACSAGASGSVGLVAARRGRAR